MGNKIFFCYPNHRFIDKDLSCKYNLLTFYKYLLVQIYNISDKTKIWPLHFLQIKDFPNIPYNSSNCTGMSGKFLICIECLQGPDYMQTFLRNVSIKSKIYNLNWQIFYLCLTLHTFLTSHTNTIQDITKHPYLQIFDLYDVRWCMKIC